MPGIVPFPTVIETPLRLEPVTRDPFGDVAAVGAVVSTPGSATAAARPPAHAGQSA